MKGGVASERHFISPFTGELGLTTFQRESSAPVESESYLGRNPRQSLKEWLWLLILRGLRDHQLGFFRLGFFAA